MTDNPCPSCVETIADWLASRHPRRTEYYAHLVRNHFLPKSPAQQLDDQEPEALVEPRIIVRAAKCGHHFDEGCNACASAEKWANAQLDELRAQLAESQSEREEQARLLGMSGSREAKLR